MNKTKKKEAYRETEAFAAFPAAVILLFSKQPSFLGNTYISIKRNK